MLESCELPGLGTDKNVTCLLSCLVQHHSDSGKAAAHRQTPLDTSVPGKPCQSSKCEPKPRNSELKIIVQTLTMRLHPSCLARICILAGGPEKVLRQIQAQHKIDKPQDYDDNDEHDGDYDDDDDDDCCCCCCCYYSVSLDAQTSEDVFAWPLWAT